MRLTTPVKQYSLCSSQTRLLGSGAHSSQLWTRHWTVWRALISSTDTMPVITLSILASTTRDILKSFDFSFPLRLARVFSLSSSESYFSSGHAVRGSDLVSYEEWWWGWWVRKVLSSFSTSKSLLSLSSSLTFPPSSTASESYSNISSSDIIFPVGTAWSLQKRK